MIYEFKSRATGTITMTQSVAEHLLEIIGKESGSTGIITVAQIPVAVDALKKAIEHDRHHRAGAEPADGDADPDAEEQVVSLAHRAYPFIEMLEQAHLAGKDVTWGV